MRIIVRPFATIRENARDRGQLEGASTFAIDLLPRSCIKDLLEIIGLNPEIGVVAVSKGQILRKDDALYEGQEVALFPYLAGG